MRSSRLRGKIVYSFCVEFVTQFIDFLSVSVPPWWTLNLSMRNHLVFIGDSLTQWGDWGQRFPGYQVINLGIAGETVEGLLARRERIRTKIDNPDFIFLMTGINNIATGQYDIVPPYREIVRNLTTWYNQAIVVVQSLLPVDIEWVSKDVIPGYQRPSRKDRPRIWRRVSRRVQFLCGCEGNSEERLSFR